MGTGEVRHLCRLQFAEDEDLTRHTLERKPDSHNSNNTLKKVYETKNSIQFPHCNFPTLFPLRSSSAGFATAKLKLTRKESDATFQLLCM